MRHLGLASFLFAASLAAGCAESPLQREALQGLLARHLLVSLPEEIPFPPLTLRSASSSGAASPNASLGQQMMDSLGNSGLEQRLGNALADSGSSLGRDGAEFFARELRASGLFAGVNHAGGEAQLSLKVEAWGLAWDDSSARYLPLLEMDASLSLPLIGEVWRCRRTAEDASSQLRGQALDLDPSSLAGRPQNLSNALDSIAADLAKQMIDDLARKSKAP